MSSQLLPPENNSPASILDLPDELLHFVFTDVARSELPAPVVDIRLSFLRSEANSRSQRLGFLRLLEVCRRFHALLLSSPDLWGIAALRLPPGPGRLALERSKSAPLRAEINGLTIARSSATALAIEHAARLGELNAQDLTTEDFENICKNPLSNLKTLGLQSSMSSLTLYALKDTLIDAPVLETVWLAFYNENNLPFGYRGAGGVMFSLPSLRSLEIDTTVSDVDTAQKMGWIVDMLRSAPRLERLKLTIDDFGPNIPWTRVFGSRAVKLQHLRTLELTGSRARDMACFYKRVCKVPPARLFITIRDPLDTNCNDAVAKLIKAFGPALQRPDHDGLLVRYEREYKKHMLSVGVFPALDDPGRYNRRFPTRVPEICQLSMLSPEPFDEPLFVQVTKTLMAALAPKAITQLVIDESERLTDEPEYGAWCRALRPITSLCPDATSLVTYHDGREYWESFSLATAPTALPALETMCIAPFVDLKRGDAFYLWWQELVAWLKHRADAGIRLRRLRITGSVRRWNLRRVEGGDVGDAGLDKEMFAQASKFVDELLDERADYTFV